MQRGLAICHSVQLGVPVRPVPPGPAPLLRSAPCPPAEQKATGEPQERQRQARGQPGSLRDRHCDHGLSAGRPGDRGSHRRVQALLGAWLGAGIELQRDKVAGSEDSCSCPVPALGSVPMEVGVGGCHYKQPVPLKGEETRVRASCGCEVAPHGAGGRWRALGGAGRGVSVSLSETWWPTQQERWLARTWRALS